ncbi:hypothetical protein [Pyxidicoccus xibeiensis]|uniref:hypothetical protein n=1 Tax=Pyxidicoccus xibeiensis TaxID=2906759 RepID=UPI0020A7A6C7|nr:hypothetical protein [Pyxidicoccus xibeiensis]MCP3139569.1 hypothetical protein [Pyxidicoccus xibeiensis]
MSYQDILENSALTPRVTAVLGFWDTKEARFSYVFLPPTGALSATVAGLTLATQAGTFNGSNVSCVSPGCPLVPAALPYYVVSCAAAIRNGQTLVSDVEYRVWPAYIDVELVSVDENGQLLANEAIAFHVQEKKPADGTPWRAVLRKVTNAQTGACRVQFQQPAYLGPTEVIVPKPYVVKQWDTGSATVGRVRRARVQTTFTAGFLGPLANAKVQQVINRDSGAEGRDGKGRVITFVVGGKGDGARAPLNKIALEGADIFITCTFSRKSKRSNELPELKGVLDLAKTQGGKVQTGRVVVGADKEASFQVDLGIAGGETCKVEIGARKGTVTDTLDFETWREVEYELLQPVADGDDRLTDFTVLKSKTVLGLKDETVAAITTCLDDVFVKLVERRADFLRKSDLVDGGRYNVFDGALLGKDAGTQFFVLTERRKDELLGRMMQHRDKRTMSLLLCDFAALPRQWDQSFAEVEGPVERDVAEKRFAFEHTLDDSVGGVGAGVFCIQKLAWKASKCRTLAADGDDGFPGFWEDITDAQDPGGALRAGVEYTTEVAIRAHVELLLARKVRLKAPTEDPSYLGVRLPVVGGTFRSGGHEFQITLQVQGVCVHLVGGMALAGDAVLSMALGQMHVNALARTLTHELGHNMGQAYGGKTLDPAFGRTSPIPGLPFPKVVPEGDIYTGKTHQGLHCASGLTNKGAENYDFSTYPLAGEEHTCVMFGTAVHTSDKVYMFCAGCREHLLAEDLDDIRRDWRR